MKQAQIVAITNILNRFQNDISLPNDISYAFFRHSVFTLCLRDTYRIIGRW